MSVAGMHGSCEGIYQCSDIITCMLLPRINGIYMYVCVCCYTCSYLYICMHVGERDRLTGVEVVSTDVIFYVW
jgi:hypothetical protein